MTDEESDPKQTHDPKPSGTTQGSNLEERPSPPASPAPPDKQRQALPEGEDGHWDRPDD